MTLRVSNLWRFYTTRHCRCGYLLYLTHKAPFGMVERGMMQVVQSSKRSLTMPPFRSMAKDWLGDARIKWRLSLSMPKVKRERSACRWMVSNITSISSTATTTIYIRLLRNNRHAAIVYKHVSPVLILLLSLFNSTTTTLLLPLWMTLQLCNRRHNMCNLF